MFNKNSISFRLFSVGILSASLVACGGGGGGSSFDGITSLTTAQKQVIARTAVDAADIFELIDLIFTVTDQIDSLTSGSLACVSGTGTSTIVNNGSASFEAGDSITISGANCIDSDGDTIINGTVAITGSTIGGATATTASFTGADASLSDGSIIDGSIQIIPSIDYNPTTGTGSINVSIDQFTATNSGITIGLQNGDYNFALSGNSYTYKVNHETTSSLFTGTVKAQTGASGFTGSTATDAFGDFTVDNPLAGNMTITFPDDSTATVDANTGSVATYALTVGSETTTELWGQ